MYYCGCCNKPFKRAPYNRLYGFGSVSAHIHEVDPVDPRFRYIIVLCRKCKKKGTVYFSDDSISVEHYHRHKLLTPVNRKGTPMALGMRIGYYTRRADHV